MLMRRDCLFIVVKNREIEQEVFQHVIAPGVAGYTCHMDQRAFILRHITLVVPW